MCSMCIIPLDKCSINLNDRERPISLIALNLFVIERNVYNLFFGHSKINIEKHITNRSCLQSAPFFPSHYRPILKPIGSTEVLCYLQPWFVTSLKITDLTSRQFTRWNKKTIYYMRNAKNANRSEVGIFLFCMVVVCLSRQTSTGCHIRNAKTVIMYFMYFSMARNTSSKSIP